ncbi:hypothetical protein F5B20DRAFT_548278 [Whalleya microplaca]|nr:hypothetical protein F5B20DRAFT_548278 [Whalleya microplaca]
MADSSWEGLCLFLYEQNSSAAYSNEPPWKAPAVLADQIRESGPAAYQFFPEHHFFARVYRPSAVWAALLNRQPTFLCSPEWTVVPWEHLPRTPLDDLLDIVVLLPSTFSRADRIITSDPGCCARQLKAKDLLSNCVNIETQFEIWYSMVRQSVDEQQSPLFWSANTMASVSQITFGDSFEFQTPLMGLVHVYYWSVLISFHQCIYALLQIVFESDSGSSSGPSMPPEIPAGLDPRKYQLGPIKLLAANVRRSLDFTLRTTWQPDLLAAPFWIINEFYNGLRHFGDGELECLWCANYKGRLEKKSTEMSAWLQEKKWTEIRQFG